MDQGPYGAHETSRSRLRLATAPVNWNNNDIPGWRENTPFPQILDRMVEAGFSATEYDGSFGTDADQLVQEATKRGVSWCGCYQWVDFLNEEGLSAQIEAFAPTLELLQAIGCRHLIVSDSLRPHRVAMAGRVPSDGSESLEESDIATIANGAHRLAETAAGFDIAVHYHNHVGTWIEAPREVDALLGHLDASRVKLCFDTGHFAYGGGNAATFIQEHIHTIGYLHIKDVDSQTLLNARKRELTFIDALQEIVFSPIGTGQADIPAILEQLVAHDFDGWVVVEQDTCAGDPTANAQANVRFITEWLSAHELASPNTR